jgi:ammonia channel protein AmtB
MACVNTNLAASCAGLTWLFLDKVHLEEKKWGAIGWCSGAVAGLVAITPAAGFVPPWSAVIIGCLGSVACNYATRLKFLFGIDEHLDIFAVHAVGGIVGNLLTYALPEAPFFTIRSPLRCFGLTLVGVFLQQTISLRWMASPSSQEAG